MWHSTSAQCRLPDMHNTLFHMTKQTNSILRTINIPHIPATISFIVTTQLYIGGRPMLLHELWVPKNETCKFFLNHTRKCYITFFSLFFLEAFKTLIRGSYEAIVLYHFWSRPQRVIGFILNGISTIVFGAIMVSLLWQLLSYCKSNFFSLSGRILVMGGTMV